MIPKWIAFDAGGLTGEAFQVDGERHGRHVVECIYDADSERWQCRRLVKGDVWSDRPDLQTLAGVLNWVRTIHCTKITVHACFDVPKK